MDDWIKTQISRYKALDYDAAQSEMASVIDLCSKYSSENVEKVDLADLYIRVHALLSIGMKFSDSILREALLFFVSYSQSCISGIAMVHLSKTTLLFVKYHLNSCEQPEQDLLAKMFGNFVLSDIEVIFHNVSECLVVLLKGLWKFSIGQDIAQICGLSAKFHLIFLKRLSSLTEKISMSESFLNDSFKLCLDVVSERTSPNSVKVIKWLHRSANKGFDANILFNDRHCFKNQSCADLFSELFNLGQTKLVPDRRLSAEVMALSETYSLPAHNMYDLKSRYMSFLTANIVDRIGNWDLVIVLLSIILDYSPESTKNVENTVKMIISTCNSELLVILDDFLDCRSTLRGSQLILNHIESQNNPSFTAGLINIALFSGFEELRIAAYRVLERGQTVNNQLAIEKTSNEWNTLIQNIHSLPDASRIFSNDLLSANLSDIAIIISCLNGILLCPKLGPNLRYPELADTAFKYLDHFYNLCNSETPESYSTENTEEDYETRNEWKVVGLSAELLVKLATEGSTELRIKSASVLQSFISNLKHRGAFTALYEPVLEIYRLIFAEDETRIDDIERQTWKMILAETDVDNYTRRSAGLPFLLRAFMHSIPAHLKMQVCCRTMKQLIDLATSSRSNIVKIRAINIACEITMDKTFGDIFAEQSLQLFKISFDYLKSEVWGLRNVGLRLFSAIFKKEFISKCDNSDRVDIRKIAQYIDVLTGILVNADESQHYTLLLCLSRILIPGQVRESCKTFIDATVSFLLLISHRHYYHWRLVESVSSSFNLNITSSTSIVRANSSDPLPSFITDKFVTIPHLRLDLNTTHIKDACLEDYLNRLHSIPQDFLAELMTFISESVAVTRRTAAAKSLSRFSNTHKNLTMEYIRPLYKLLLDDEEPIRYIACQVARQLFDSVIINSPLFYVNEIWSYVGQQSHSIQHDMYNAIFYQDFLKDFNREHSNMTENPIFRVEPQNLYRDIYIETIIIKKHLSADVIKVEDSLVKSCRGKTSVELGYLYRSAKCVSLLAHARNP